MDACVSIAVVGTAWTDAWGLIPDHDGDPLPALGLRWTVAVPGPNVGGSRPSYVNVLVFDGGRCGQ